VAAPAMAAVFRNLRRSSIGDMTFLPFIVQLLCS
jgi:hypothetical protein